MYFMMLFRLRTADAMRQEGNNAFHAKSWSTALGFYDQALRCLNWLTFEDLENVDNEGTSRLWDEEQKLQFNRYNGTLCLLLTHGVKM